MIRFLRWLVIAVVAIILLLFAYANREWVTVSLDPFAPRDEAAVSVAAPMFVVVIVAAMLGVIAGAAATWVTQGRHRRAARQHRAEADRYRSEAESLRAAQSSLPRP